MKMIKRTLIILIIAATIFTVVECSKTEEIDNIKQEQGEDTLPEEEEKHKDDKPEEKEEIESPIELG